MFRLREPKIRMPPAEHIEKANTRRIASELEAEMERELFSLFDSMGEETVRQQLRTALEQRDWQRVEAAIPWDTFLAGLMLAEVKMARRAVLRSGQAAARELSRGLNIGMTLAFDQVNPRAVDWIQLHAAQLVREVGDETKGAVREIIRRAFEQGMHPYVAAREIQQIVGLTMRQGIAVDNYYKRLLRDGKYPQSVIERYTDRYAKQMQRYRARTIARYETQMASHLGQQDLWTQAEQRGLLPANTMREWLTAEDERVCPRCAPMDGQTVGLHEPFVSLDGEHVLTPPLHQNCRCSVGLVFPE